MGVRSKFSALIFLCSVSLIAFLGERSVAATKGSEVVIAGKTVSDLDALFIRDKEYLELLAGMLSRMNICYPSGPTRHYEEAGELYGDPTFKVFYTCQNDNSKSIVLRFSIIDGGTLDFAGQVSDEGEK